jgi:hypothetical protein
LTTLSNTAVAMVRLLANATDFISPEADKMVTALVVIIIHFEKNKIHKTSL